MKSIELNIQDALYFADKQYEATQGEAVEAITKLEKGMGLGSDYIGWVNLASQTPAELVEKINATAARLRADCEYVVCIGIGGSYLGAKAVNTALSDSFADYYAPKPNEPKVLYAGQNIGEEYTAELQKLLEGKKFGIIVISKSGTTTEPAIAFRILRDQLEKQAGTEASKDLIVAITDASKGALRTMADQEGWETYVIPDNVGGRFSVLTPVGLLPIAVAGHDIAKLLQGAAIWRRLQSIPAQTIWPRYMRVCVMPSTAVAKKSNCSSTILPSSISSRSGGNSSTVSRRVRTARVSSPHLSTTLPTCTPWANGFRRVSARFSRL